LATGLRFATAFFFGVAFRFVADFFFLAAIWCLLGRGRRKVAADASYVSCDSRRWNSASLSR
jgi:hypothetical protein